MLSCRCRFACCLRGTLTAQPVRSDSRNGSARSAATRSRAESRRARRPRRPTASISRTRASSTSRTIGLLRMSFLIGVLEGFHRSPALQAAMSRTSPRSSRCGPRVAIELGLARQSPASSSARASPCPRGPAPRIVCLTMRDPRASESVITAEPPVAGEPRGGVLHEAIESVQLAVHPDPERLERARRRIDPLPPSRRHRAPHQRCQLARRSRSAARATSVRAMRRDVPLLAELEDRVGQFLLRRRIHQVRRRRRPPI
mgnify:CR=1 FL=1